MLMKYTLTTLLLLTAGISDSCYAQPVSGSGPFTMQQAIQYAYDHNIAIRESDINRRLATLQQLQSELSQLPDVNAIGLYGHSSGVSINPTTNEYVDNSYAYSTAALDANLLVFGWFARRNNIAASKLERNAAEADLDQAKKRRSAQCGYRLPAHTAGYGAAAD